MIPNPGQFNKDYKDYSSKKHENLTSKLRGHAEKKPVDKEYEAFKSDYLKRDLSGRYHGYQAPDGSWHGHPASESAIKAHYKWSKMTVDERKAHNQRMKDWEHRLQKAPEREKKKVVPKPLPPKGEQPTLPGMGIARSKEEKKYNKKDFNKERINKKKDKYKGDDDDKNPPMSGGSKVPRKPKPSPQSPGTYRPIERKVDPDFAKKHDRYRVLAI